MHAKGAKGSGVVAAIAATLPTLVPPLLLGFLLPSQLANAREQVFDAPFGDLNNG
jgi:hypothetical protein